MNYSGTIRYLNSFINYEKITNWPYKKSLKLERFKEFLKTIDNPQDSLRCLHIAGTKGKGSTCAFVAYILRQAGYKVGIYTSPHLSDFRERIRILTPNSTTHRVAPSALQTPNAEFEGMISQRELTDLVERLKPAIGKYNKNSKYGPLSFFEVYTAMGFVYFKKKNTDLVVLETGLGGRLDATNTVNPLVCAITPISYEHTQKLGRTLREIAAEKAGIIKTNPIVITAPQDKEAKQVIKERCKKTGIRLFDVGRDITYHKTKDGFSVRGVFKNYSNLKTRLIGEHQFVNASVAIGVVEALKNYDIVVGADAIRKGIFNTFWPGRLEVISKNPDVILDGAQNIASVKALKEAIREKFKYKNLILVLGISKDKDIKGVCKELYYLADKAILTKADNPRAAQPNILKKYFTGKAHYLTRNVKEAKKLAYRIAAGEDLILVCGSLFVVGEFREC